MSSSGSGGGGRVHASQASPFDVVQTVDVSVDSGLACRLRAHRDEFQAYRCRPRGDELASLLVSGGELGEASLVEVLSEEIVRALVESQSQELEAIVDECAEAVFERI